MQTQLNPTNASAQASLVKPLPQKPSAQPVQRPPPTVVVKSFDLTQSSKPTKITTAANQKKDNVYNPIQVPSPGSKAITPDGPKVDRHEKKKPSKQSSTQKATPNVEKAKPRPSSQEPIPIKKVKTDAPEGTSAKNRDVQPPKEHSKPHEQSQKPKTSPQDSLTKEKGHSSNKTPSEFPPKPGQSKEKPLTNGQEKYIPIPKKNSGTGQAQPQIEPKQQTSLVAQTLTQQKHSQEQLTLQDKEKQRLQEMLRDSKKIKPSKPRERQKKSSAAQSSQKPRDMKPNDPKKEPPKSVKKMTFSLQQQKPASKPAVVKQQRRVIHEDYDRDDSFIDDNDYDQDPSAEVEVAKALNQLNMLKQRNGTDGEDDISEANAEQLRKEEKRSQMIGFLEDWKEEERLKRLEKKKRKEREQRERERKQKKEKERALRMEQQKHASQVPHQEESKPSEIPK